MLRISLLDLSYYPNSSASELFKQLLLSDYVYLPLQGLSRVTLIATCMRVARAAQWLELWSVDSKIW
jgi:hypothetical protein